MAQILRNKEFQHQQSSKSVDGTTDPDKIRWGRAKMLMAVVLGDVAESIEQVLQELKFK